MVCDSFILIVRAPTEFKSDYTIDSFFEEVLYLINSQRTTWTFCDDISMRK
jgi:hypothetical protein